jgi:hypothetical protein
MSFSYRITKARIQTHAYTVYCSLLRNWLISSDLVICFTEKQELNELTRYYDLLSQIVRLRKAISKRTLFSFNAAFICNVWKEC